MTSGTPDYFRTVRQNCGAAKSDADVTVVTASGLTVLATIVGKGMIYGGYMMLDHSSSQKDGVPILIVDDEIINALSFSDLIVNNLTRETAIALYLLKFDEIDFAYAVAIARGITFDSNFSLTYNEVDGETPAVYHSVTYALI